MTIKSRIIINKHLSKSMTNKNKKTWKKYLISSLITFVSGFVMVILIDIDSLDLQSLENGTLFGLIFSGARAGIKAVMEYFLVETKDL